MVSLERAKRLLKSKETQKEYEMLKTPVAKFTPVEALKPEAVIAPAFHPPEVQNMTAIEALQAGSPRPPAQAGYVPQTAQKAAFDRGINEFKKGVVDKARIFGENLMAGIGQGNKAFYGALQSIGGDKIPGVNKVLEFGKEVAERDISKGGTDIGSQLIQAVPNAATSLGMAAMTKGVSLVPQLGKSAIQQAIQTMLRNPAFYNSLIRSYGGAYNEAREAGQDRGTAITAGLLTGIPEAVIGQAGGIEQVFKRPAKGLLPTIVRTALEEVGEEIAQYPFGGAVKKALYAPETPIYSTTEEAVINPVEMGEAALISGFMGGLMGGVGKVMTGDVRIKPVQKTYIDYQAETPRSPAIYGEPIQQTQQRLFAGDTQQEAQPMFRAEQEVQQPQQQATREILSTDSSTGEVFKQGDYVYKNTTRSGWKQNRATPQPTIEAEVYETLKGNDNILDGELVDYEGEQKIKTPYVKNIVSIDTVPKDKRASIGRNIISKNYSNIVDAVQALSNAGYSYSDPLQFGYHNGKLKLMDFSNASKTDVKTATENNYELLTSFFDAFGLDGYAKIISDGMRILDDLQTYTTDEIVNGDMLAEPEHIAIVQQAAKTGVKPNNVYFTRNARMVQTKTPIGQTENINGVTYVFSESPLPPNEISDWELTPIYQQPAPIGGEPISQPLELPDLPVRYNPNLKNEASNKGDHIEVGDKFYQLSPEQQETILVHENAHNIADEYLFKQRHFEEIMNNKAFGETKTAPNGRTYWEGIFGDVGANSVVETFTEAIAVYKGNPQWLQERHPQAYEYIKNNVVEGLSAQQGFTPIGGEPQAMPEQARIFGEPEIPKGQRERGVSRNIRTDINSPEGLRVSFEQEPLTYTQKSNIETLSRAEQIMSEGYETARAKLDEMLDRMDTEAAPLAVMLAREAWTKGDKKGSRQIVAHAAEKAIQAGRFGQAFRILRDTDPASLLMSMQNQIKKLNEDGRKQYGKRWTDIELTDTEIELIMNTPLESEAELQELQQIIGKRIANDLPSDIMEKFNAWRRVAMLFNPKTHIRNIGGNVLMSGLQRTSDIVATGLEKVFVPKEQRTKALFWKGDENLVQKVNDSWNANKSKLTQESRYDIASLKALGFDKRIFQSDILQALNDITMKGLNLGDIPFVEAAYKNSLGQFMKARGLAEVTPEAELYATRRAFEATFKETNEMASILNRLKQKPVVGTLVEGAIPFTKTPANITMRAIDYSPGGLLKALYDVKAGKPAAQVIEDVSKGLTGTALMALGMWLQKIGWARVERSRSEKAEGLYRELGEQTNSIITPYGSYTFDWAQPFAVPLAMGIAIMETISKRKDGESLANALLEGLYAGGDTIFNMTMLKNIKDIFGSGGSPTKKIFSIPVAYIEQFIPSISGQAARTIDPIRRSTYDPDPMKQEWKRIKSRIPFASKTLEPMLNVWGEEQRQGGILEQFISPGYFATPTDDHVTLEVARLYDAFKDTDMLPKVAPAKFSSDKVEYVLSAEQRTQFQRDMGQDNYNDIARFISSAEYQRLTDTQKVKRIKGIINDNYNDMKDAIIKASALKGN